MKILKRVLKISFYLILILYIPGFLLSLYQLISYGDIPKCFHGCGWLGIFAYLVFYPFLNTLFITHCIFMFIYDLYFRVK